MKGIVLAGGKGSRLYPMTYGLSKQLLPIYDKPMVYYPLSLLLLAGIRDILMITTERDQEAFQRMLGDGSQWGIKLSYCVQEEPRGIAEAFLLGEEFIGKDAVALVLGDNIFYGSGFSDLLLEVSQKNRGATIFGYYVSNPERYGVVEFDEQKKVKSIVEKPEKPKSQYAVPGLYFYDSEVVTIAKKMKPSDRGELEITAINQAYLEKGELEVVLLGRGMAWLDTGTCDSLMDASNYVATVQKRQGQMIACLEEIAYAKKYIDKEGLIKQMDKMQGTEYALYLKKLCEE
ncbi:glucose-1-phosphate thymidylyltransferase RfbA [Clostridia bacterium]|nr:glucose-1-phosphate thymidylyltransferase RfbA [Clostridia bacterium]